MGVQNRSGKYFKFLIYAVIVVLINIVGITLFVRKDLTENKIYSLSDVSKEVVSTLTEPLTIKVFFTKNLPAPHNNTERYLRDLLTEYALHANKFFNYQFYDVSPETEGLGPSAKENQELANSYGIYPIQIQALEEDEVKFKVAYMGLVIIHGDIVEKIPTMTTIEGLEYDLTTAIQKVNNKISSLLGLSENIQVRLYMSSSLKTVAPLIGLDELADLPENVKDIVAKLNSKNYGRLEYKFIDSATDEEQAEASQRYNIMALKWPDLGDGKVSAGQGIIGLVMTFKEKVASLPILRVFRVPVIGTQYQLSKAEEIEEMVNGQVESLLDINERFAYLGGNGTLALTASMPSMGQDQEAVARFTEMVKKTYSPKVFMIDKDPVPEDAQCIVLARPTEPFSDYELFQIDQALMRGQNIAIFLEPFKEVRMPQVNAMGFEQQTVNHEPLDTGLEKLLAHYGVSIKRSIIMDEQCFNQPLPQRMGGGERPIYFAPIVKQDNINNVLPFMNNIKELIVFKASPVKLDKERIRENGLNATTLLSSSEKSWEMKPPIRLNPQVNRPPGPDAQRESQDIACLIEGEFPSYFAGKSIPEKPAAEKDDNAGDKGDGDAADKDKEAVTSPTEDIVGEGMILEKGKPAKLFITGCSAFIKDDLLNGGERTPNAMFTMNMLDFMNGRGGIAVMRSKTQKINPLEESAVFTKTAVKIFNIAGLPALVVLFGLAVWTRRHMKKRSIQRMFDTN